MSEERETGDGGRGSGAGGQEMGGGGRRGAAPSYGSGGLASASGPKRERGTLFSRARFPSRRAPRGFVAACLLLAVLWALPAAHGTRPDAADEDGLAADLSLLEVGSARKLVAPPAEPSEIKIVSYNIRYRVGEDLRELIKLLKDDPEIGGAALIGLQEVDRNKKRTDNENTPRLMAEALGMHYAWAAPPAPRPKGGEKSREKDAEEEETGVAILSPYPLSDVERLVLPHEGPNRRRRAGLGATVRVGRDEVRFYSVHAETRMPVERKVEHWRIVLEDLGRRPGIQHAVVVGDFNTIKEKDVRAARALFTDAGFATPFSDEDATFKVAFFDFKLDWVWLRGINALSHGIDKKVGLSDHWPLWVRARLEKRPPAEPPPASR